MSYGAYGACAYGPPRPLRLGAERGRTWLRAGVRAGLLWGVLGGLAGGLSPSCVVPDPEYCATSAQCPVIDSPQGPVQLVCNTSRHVCMSGACGSDADCTDFAAPRCDRTTNTCTSCRVGDTTDTSCTHFLDRKLCISASSGAGTLCAECRSNTDCPAATPICDNYQCRKCGAHSDCQGALKCDDGVACTDSLVCIQEGDLPAEPAGALVGRCAQNGSGKSGRVIYVNNQGACSETNPGSAYAMPLCSLYAGLMMATAQSRPYIRVVGKNLKPPNATISEGSYVFVGAPTRDFPEIATVEGRGVLFTVKDSGSLTLDQLHLVEDQANTTLVQCVGVGSLLPKLTLRSSILTGATPPTATAVSAGAVNTANCDTLLDGNIIGVRTTAELSDPMAMVHGAGLVIGDTANNRSSSYLIQNNIIAGNAGFAVNLSGVSSDSAKFVLRFNTIVGNGRATQGTYGAVVCPLGSYMMEFSHSIVSDNSTFPGGSQFLFPSSCGLKDLVVGTNETGTDPLFKKSPALDPMFRLQAGAQNSDCCIDKVTPMAGETLPKWDVDQRPRPQGKKWDIGAAELTQ